MIVLDTNVVSEIMRLRPDEREVRQLTRASEAHRRVAEVPLNRALVQEVRAQGVDVRRAAETGLRAALRQTET